MVDTPKKGISRQEGETDVSRRRVAPGINVATISLEPPQPVVVIAGHGSDLRWDGDRQGEEPGTDFLRSTFLHWAEKSGVDLEFVQVRRHQGLTSEDRAVSVVSLE